MRTQFVELRQGTTPLAQFEARFTSLSRFAPELVVTEERRCIEFERRLHDDILERVVGSLHRNYHTLVEATAHIEATNLDIGRDREEAISAIPTVRGYSRPSKQQRRAGFQTQLELILPRPSSQTGHKVASCSQGEQSPKPILI